MSDDDCFFMDFDSESEAVDMASRRAPTKAEGLAAPAVRREPEGRTSHPHPEVTPEMIEAGKRALMNGSRDIAAWHDETLTHWAIAIFCAMKAKEPL